MKSIEIKKELNMSYYELVIYLLEKYGVAKYDYFCNESFKSKNHKASRTDEGLICHHIDEDKGVMLSSMIFAKYYPFDYQKANRLVYCNILEHLILHFKIAEEQNEDFEPMFFGIGGMSIIIRQTNDYFNGFKYSQQYLINEYNLIKNNYKDYISILKMVLELIGNNKENKQKLSAGWDGKTIKKIYNEL